MKKTSANVSNMGHNLSPLSAGVQLSVPDFEKWGSEKKMSPWGNLTLNVPIPSKVKPFEAPQRSVKIKI